MPFARRRLAGSKEVHPLVGQRRDLDVQQRQIDMLAQSAAVPLVECCQHRRRRIKAGQKIRYRHSNLRRLSLRRAGNAHKASHGLNQEIIAWFVLVGPVWPKPVIEQ